MRDGRTVDLMAVVTQPDRPGHRGKLTAPPVKARALDHGIRVIQPRRLVGNGPRWDTPAMWDAVIRLHPEALVWAAYGGIVPKRVIDAVRGRAVNVHPSVLPRWRGADPVAHAILAGDRETGVCLMEATAELDAGPVITLLTTEVVPGETTGDLEARLARHGARLLEDQLAAYLSGSLRPAPQEGEVVWAPKLDPRGGELDLTRPAEEVARIVRAYSPDPGAFTTFRGQRLRLLRASVAGGPPGEHGTLKVERGEPYVAAGAGWLRLDEVQPAGKRATSGADWARGLRDLEGATVPS